MAANMTRTHTHPLITAALVLFLASVASGFTCNMAAIPTRLRSGKKEAKESWFVSLGDKVATLLVKSPVFPVLRNQAKQTMKTSAEEAGVKWDDEVARLQALKDWDAAKRELEEEAGGPVEVPDYYKKPFHAYDKGNLEWSAAFEQELASKAVGVRNFPSAGAKGEAKLRGAYSDKMVELGVVVEEGGTIVDFGCGTGTSCVELAQLFPHASSVTGVDLSPEMVTVGRHFLEERNVDSRISLKLADMASTGLKDDSASMVSISLVLHELPGEARRAVLAEAARILRPGGTLSIFEMDPSAPGYKKLRKNAMLFSILRSTEPYLDDYFEGCTSGDFWSELNDAGFSVIRVKEGTGRHFVVAALKPGLMDLRCSDEERMARDEHFSSPFQGLASQGNAVVPALALAVLVSAGITLSHAPLPH
ncbi:unnamed protein product [Chrysoparadoxa australica]